MSSENIYELLYMSHLGDEYAFEALFKHFQTILRCLVSASVKSYRPLEPYREDIYQEASTVLLKAIDGYREDQNTQFVTYYNVLARRRIWNLCKKYSRGEYANREVISLDEHIREGESYYDMIAQQDPMNDPDYALRYTLASEKLQAVLNEMSEEELDAAASWMNNETYEEGAAKRGINYKTWEGRRTRVRRKIMNALKYD